MAGGRGKERAAEAATSARTLRSARGLRGLGAIVSAHTTEIERMAGEREQEKKRLEEAEKKRAEEAATAASYLRTARVLRELAPGPIDFRVRWTSHDMERGDIFQNNAPSQGLHAPRPAPSPGTSPCEDTASTLSARPWRVLGKRPIEDDSGGFDSQSRKLQCNEGELLQMKLGTGNQYGGSSLAGDKVPGGSKRVPPLSAPGYNVDKANDTPAVTTEKVYIILSDDDEDPEVVSM
ncbi:hypothetical protein M758_5G166900 [Ceratodon purpureus]|nr:hypothetical protein M758_5G166900 [Ceratodon purpureus]